MDNRGTNAWPRSSEELLFVERARSQKRFLLWYVVPKRTEPFAWLETFTHACVSRAAKRCKRIRQTVTTEVDELDLWLKLNPKQVRSTRSVVERRQNKALKRKRRNRRR